MRSGFVSLIGRPNVGKSTILNAMIGTKVSIVSNKPQTTRFLLRGVLHEDDLQIVFVDTPGIHKPKTTMGVRLNDAAKSSVADVDVNVLVLDATRPFGKGDRYIAEQLISAKVPYVVVLNKIDKVQSGEIIAQLSAVAHLDAVAFVPISAKTGNGIDRLVGGLRDLMPEGPAWFPPDIVRETEDPQWVGELVREQLLAVLREELPHSIATEVTEWEWPFVRCTIWVERNSQKGIVIGKNGSVLKRVGELARTQMPEGMYLELIVKVDPSWQQQARSLDRLGY